MLIDEVHLLNENRGAALEAGCVGRIRMVGQLPEMAKVTRLLPFESSSDGAHSAHLRAIATIFIQFLLYVRTCSWQCR